MRRAEGGRKAAHIYFIQQQRVELAPGFKGDKQVQKVHA